MQYRRINALRYIHDVMSSSNFTIVQAIQNYDMAIQRQIQQERLAEEQRRADAEEQAAWAAEEAARAARRTERNAEQTSDSSRSYSPPPKQEKKDYFMTRSCLRLSRGGFDAQLCGRCSLAPVCKHAGR